LVEKNYARTEQEIALAVQRAREASEALSSLTQDLRSFDLQDYLNIEGKFDLSDLKTFIEFAIVRLGGSILPRGEFFRIETPKVLQRYSNVLPRYELVAFDREAAMRKRSAELIGLGHPLVEALIQYLQQATYPGDVAVFQREPSEAEPHCVVETLITIDLEDGTRHNEFKIIRVTVSGDVQVMPEEWALSRLERRQTANNSSSQAISHLNWPMIRQAYEGAIGAIVTQAKLSVERPVSARVRLIGVAAVV
jgi:hypothetical protein